MYRYDLILKVGEAEQVQEVQGNLNYEAKQVTG